MKKVKYEDYIALMQRVYPVQTKRITNGNKNSGEVWVDTEKSWAALDPFLQEDVMKGLKRMMDAGKRDHNDKQQDSRIIERR